MTKRLVLRGGRIFGSSGLYRGDVVIEGGVVVSVGDPSKASGGAEVIDLDGMVLAMAFADLHTHTRLPGDGEAETLVGVTNSGLLGGFSFLMALANTSPVVDSVSVVRAARAIYARSPLDIEVAAAVTLGRAGERMVDIESLAREGVSYFSDDGSPVADPRILRRALGLAKRLGLRIGQHAQDFHLSEGGAVNEGEYSERLGIPAMGELAESVVVARDLELVRETGGAYHAMHISSLASLELLRSARAQGLPVTCEVTPHHLYFEDSVLERFDTNFKVNPPIRSEATRRGLVAAFARGAIDVIGTDHAPHPSWMKEASFRDAPFGLIGLQSAFAASYSALLGDAEPNSDEGVHALCRVLEGLSSSPRQLMGRDAFIEVGVPGDLVVLDPTEYVTQRMSDVASASKNSPYLNERLRGRVRGTLIKGEIAMWDNEIKMEIAP